MGCCPSKGPAATPSKAPAAPVTTQDAVGPPTELLMDRGDGDLLDKSDAEPQIEDGRAAVEPQPLSPEDVPISSTYHRIQSAKVAQQEAQRLEGRRREQQQCEREVQEYKAALQLAA